MPIKQKRLTILIVVTAALGCSLTALTLTATNRIPPAPRRMLETAAQFELLSLDPNTHNVTSPESFHGFQVLGRTTIHDPATRDRLVRALEQSIAESPAIPAACTFQPRHGIHLTQETSTVDFVICYTCGDIDIYVDGQRDKNCFTTDSARQVFDQTLRDAAVPLPKPAAE